MTIFKVMFRFQRRVVAEKSYLISRSRVGLSTLGPRQRLHFCFTFVTCIKTCHELQANRKQQISPPVVRN